MILTSGWLYEQMKPPMKKTLKWHANIMIQSHNERHVAENGKTINVVYKKIS
jgi:hypothetical protein